MTNPGKVTWPLPAHTRGKHEVLRNYLSAWFPIIGSFSPRLAFIDAFAGPGEYEGGEPGSPQIALDVFRQARNAKECTFLFIDENPQVCAHLREILARHPPPASALVQIEASDSDARITELLDSLPEGRQSPPAFVMLDPYGVKGIRMSLIRGLMASAKTEIYVTFMYEWIDRFKASPEFEPHLDELYGTSQWRNGLGLEGSDKTRFFLDLFRDQLRAAGARYVIRFDLYSGNRLVYAIFFATKHWKGADVMKQAIWKVAPQGDFAFRDTHRGQMILGPEMMDFTALREGLQKRFRGRGWVAGEQVEEFVASGQTDFHTGQLRKQALVPLEQQALLDVGSPRKRPLTYPPGTKLRFK